MIVRCLFTIYYFYFHWRGRNFLFVNFIMVYYFFCKHRRIDDIRNLAIFFFTLISRSLSKNISSCTQHFCVNLLFFFYFFCTVYKLSSNNRDNPTLSIVNLRKSTKRMRPLCNFFFLLYYIQSSFFPPLFFFFFVILSFEGWSIRLYGGLSKYKS